MVAHEEVLPPGGELLHAAIGKGGDATADDLLVGTAHHFQLEVTDGTE